MKTGFVKHFTNFIQSPWYWLMYIISGTGLLAVALYYQYQLNELPCVLCIHVRLLIVLLVMVSFIGLLAGRNRILIALLHISTILIAYALADRSYQLLGTERGFIFSECGINSGLPDWLDVQTWVPWLFKIETTCGYTPVIAFGITMAESLLVLSGLLLVVVLSASVTVFLPDKSR